MGRYQLIFSPKAKADLATIHAFIKHDSPSNAATVVTGIFSAIRSLEQFPHRTIVSRQNPRVRRPVRSLPESVYVVFFRVDDKHHTVRLLRILHGARRRPRRFD